MTTLKKLDKSTANRISSGQVIISVVSVVKELVENALDSGAPSVHVVLIDSGASQISVSDTGSGIPAEDLPHVAGDHTTSKLHDLGGLQTLSTLGFRGEALHSIAAMADLSVQSRCSDCDTATLIIFGVEGEQTEIETGIERSVGTTVVVRDLFKRFPVRFQLLNQDKAKNVQKIYSLLTTLCLVHPTISFKLDASPSSPMVCPIHTDIAERLTETFGPMLFKELQSFDWQDDDQAIRVSGFLPKPNLQSYQKVIRTRNNHVYMYINKRPIDFPKLMKLINKIVRGHLTKPSKQYPFIFLQIDIDPSQVDVNFSPDKRKVSFRDEASVLSFIEARLEERYPSRLPGAAALPDESSSSASSMSMSLGSLSAATPATPTFPPLISDNHVSSASAFITAAAAGASNMPSPTLDLDSESPVNPPPPAAGRPASSSSGNAFQMLMAAKPQTTTTAAKKRAGAPKEKHAGLFLEEEEEDSDDFIVAAPRAKKPRKSRSGGAAAPPVSSVAPSQQQQPSMMAFMGASQSQACSAAPQQQPPVLAAQALEAPGDWQPSLRWIEGQLAASDEFAASVESRLSSSSAPLALSAQQLRVARVVGVTRGTLALVRLPHAVLLMNCARAREAVLWTRLMDGAAMPSRELHAAPVIVSRAEMPAVTWDFLNDPAMLAAYAHVYRLNGVAFETGYVDSRIGQSTVKVTGLPEGIQFGKQDFLSLVHEIHQGHQRGSLGRLPRPGQVQQALLLEVSRRSKAARHSVCTLEEARDLLARLAVDCPQLRCPHEREIFRPLLTT